MNYIVERFKWPLFVTLTMKNVDDLSSGGVRQLRRAFGKLRHRKLWSKSVRGGVATVEVTNIGNGWHPHLHTVIDCHWLAWKTKPPLPKDPIALKKEKYTNAAIELEAAWSKCLGQATSSVKVKRADRFTITKEVVKYTVKAEDLVESEGRIGDLIRALDSCRLMTTFGTAHGQKVKDIRLAAKAEAKRLRSEATPQEENQRCCGGGPFITDESLTISARIRESRKRLPCCSAS
jgi:hypothetical protein